MYSHAPAGYQCPFCLLLAGIENQWVYSRSSDIVYQDQFVTAFICSRQWHAAPGNVLVVPNQHVENIYSLPTALGGHILHIANHIGRGLKRLLGCDGYSTRQHNEPAGNQEVWHFHTHVTPRYTNDNFYRDLLTGHFTMPVEERAQLATQLRAELQRGEGGGAPSHQPDGYDCFLCAAVAGRRRSDDIVFEDENVLAIVARDQYPSCVGNILIAPKQHWENGYRLPQAVCEPIFAAAQRVAIAFRQIDGCVGVSTRQHNEPAGNQDVWHYHFHVTGRKADDRLYRSERTFVSSAEERATLVDALGMQGS